MTLQILVKIRDSKPFRQKFAIVETTFVLVLVLVYMINFSLQAIIPDSDKWQLPMTHYNDQDGVEETKATIKKLKELIVEGEERISKTYLAARA